MPTILCAECQERVRLWDDLEECFAGQTIREQVSKLQDQSALVLDNESRERALVGEVISTVALAGQISREKPVSDHGIEMEIEFKNDHREATGEMLFLQLKSGDSYLRERKCDEAEVLTIQKERQVEYWVNQKVPVTLVIRSSDSTVRWMEVRDWLRRATETGTKPVTQRAEISNPHVGESDSVTDSGSGSDADADSDTALTMRCLHMRRRQKCT